MFEKIVANSSPITPPPTIVRLSGSSPMVMSRLLLTMYGWSAGAHDGMSGRDPVATTM